MLQRRTRKKKLHLLVFQKAHRKTLIYLSCLLLESPPNGTFAGLSEKLHWLLKHLTMLEKKPKNVSLEFSSSKLYFVWIVVQHLNFELHLFASLTILRNKTFENFLNTVLLSPMLLKVEGKQCSRETISLFDMPAVSTTTIVSISLNFQVAK